MAKVVLEIFATKVFYLMMLYEITKNECFPLSFIGEGGGGGGATETVSVRLPDQ